MVISVISLCFSGLALIGCCILFAIENQRKRKG
jgi:hypothetical protein